MATSYTSETQSQKQCDTLKKTDTENKGIEQKNQDLRPRNSY